MFGRSFFRQLARLTLCQEDQTEDRTCSHSGLLHHLLFVPSLLLKVPSIIIGTDSVFPSFLIPSCFNLPLIRDEMEHEDKREKSHDA